MISFLATVNQMLPIINRNYLLILHCNVLRGKFCVTLVQNVFRMNTAVPTVDFCDTFLSYKHLISSFPNTKIVGTTTSDENLFPPFRFAFYNSRKICLKNGKKLEYL